MHLDLKSDNVLINAVMSNESYISPSVQVKLTDFGFSKLNLNNSRLTKYVGSRLWMAPEVGTSQWMASEVGEDEKNTEKYTNAADVYSFARAFFDVLTGRLPFESGKLGIFIRWFSRGRGQLYHLMIIVLCMYLQL